MGYYKHVHASTGAQTVQLTQKAPTAIKVATDFSGMEGPVLAMRRLGNVTITHVMASDIDANCRRVIAAEVSPHAKSFEDALSRSVKELPVEIDCYVFLFSMPRLFQSWDWKWCAKHTGNLLDSGIEGHKGTQIQVRCC